MRRLTLLLVAMPFLAMAVRLVATHRDPVLSGDHALIELGALDATRFHGSLGPYSRFGFFHPGPALFYVLAPVVMATARAPWAAHLGVQLVYTATAAALVALVGRRAGPAAGAGAAAVVLGWVALLRPNILAVPWNPLVIILPAALLLVATAAVQGPGVPLAIVALAGTFLVQTHVGTALLVAVCGAVAVGVAVVRRRRESGGSRRVAAGLVMVAALLWLPPAVEVLTHEPGNAGRLLRFFLTERHHPPASPVEAATLVGRELDVSRGSIPYLGTPTPAGVGRGRSRTAMGVFALLALALVVVGRRLDERFVARLGTVSLLAAAAGIVSVTRIVGETYWYLLAWTSAAVVPLAIGWMVLAVRRLPIAPTLAVAGLASVGLTAAVVVGPLYDSPAFPEEPRYRAGVREAWAIVGPLVRTTGAESVAFRADSEAPSPTIAGVAVRLERRGVHTAVSPNLVHVYGSHHRSDGREALRLAFLERGASPPPDATPLGPAAGFDLYALR